MSGLLLATVGLTALAGKVAAFPTLFSGNLNGCTIPDKGYKGHGSPEPDSSIVFAVKLVEGDFVTSYVTGEKYDIEVSPASGGPANVWIHASDGVFEVGKQAAACPEAAFSRTPLPLHSFTWTAPETASPVTFSVAASASPSDFYHTSTMDLPPGTDAALPDVFAGDDTEEMAGDESADGEMEENAAGGSTEWIGLVAVAAGILICVM